MPNLTIFRDKVKKYYRSIYKDQSRKYTLDDLGPAIGLDKDEISHRWNRTGRTPLSPQNVLDIVITLAKWKALTTWEQARELLSLMDYPLTSSPWKTALEPYLPPEHGSVSSKKEGGAAQHLQRNHQRVDWGEAPEIGAFYGRKNELEQLKQLIVENGCRVVALCGFGGMGKTRLARKFVEEHQETFDYVFWRSLQNDLPLAQFLEECIYFVSGQAHRDLPPDERQRLSLLFRYLRDHRCLLILDNFETVLHSPDYAGRYREDRQGYSELLTQAGTINHRSCLLLTSREELQEMPHFDPKSAFSFLLTGLGINETKKLLNHKKIGETQKNNVQELVTRYGGNPSALNLAAHFIQQDYDHNLAEFLAKEKIVMEGIEGLLAKHFQRLTDQEQAVMYWLAIEREPVSWDELNEDLLDPFARKVLRSLQRRSLIEKNSTDKFSLQPVILEYTTDQLIAGFSREFLTKRLSLLKSHALMKAQSKDHIRESQKHFLLEPVTQQLLHQREKAVLVETCQDLLSNLRTNDPEHPGYAAANILHLLLHLKVDLRRFDFSQLTVRQAYLQGVFLPEVTFTQADLSRSVFTKSHGSVLSLTFSPHGQWLAVGTTTREVQIWHVPEGTPLFTLPGHEDWIWSVAFSPNGRLLASGSQDGTIRLWEMGQNDGHLRTTLRDHTSLIRSVAFSPDGSLLASGSDDQTVHVWDVSTGHCLHTLRGHDKPIWAVAFSPDSQLLASSGEDGMICIWELPGGSLLTSFHGGEDWIRTLAFSPDGKFLTSGCDDRSIRVWDTATWELLNTLRDHEDRVRTLAFSPDGSLLASGSDDKSIRVWNVATWHCLRILPAHTNLVRSVAFHPDGLLLASSSDDQTVRVWDVSTGHCLHALQGYSAWIYAVAFHPDGHTLASGSADTCIHLWDVNTKTPSATLPGHTDRIRSVTFSPNGALLASGSDDKSIRVWDTATRTWIKTLGDQTEGGHTDWLRTLAFHPESQILASGSDDRSIRLWDVNSGTCFNVLQPAYSNTIWSLAFSPDGQFLASGGTDLLIHVWNTATWRLHKILRGHSHRIYTLAFQPPHGRVLASGSEDQTICLWDVTTGDCLQQLTLSQDPLSRIYTLAFSPDGRFLASGHENRTIRIWDLHTAQCIKILRDHADHVWSVAFRPPDGHMLASGSEDGTIKLWDWDAQNCLKTLRSERPYEQMDITDAKGLTGAQKRSLKALGTIG